MSYFVRDLSHRLLYCCITVRKHSRDTSAVCTVQGSYVSILVFLCVRSDRQYCASFILKARSYPRGGGFFPSLFAPVAAATCRHAISRPPWQMTLQGLGSM